MSAPDTEWLERAYGAVKELLNEYADKNAELERQLSTARADALREAADLADQWADSREFHKGGLALSNCAAAIRALIPPQEE